MTSTALMAWTKKAARNWRPEKITEWAFLLPGRRAIICQPSIGEARKLGGINMHWHDLAIRSHTVP
ncbi:hypothetical protein [Streptomyces sp. SID12501]|uniref:Uncharacterized protein n=1 Tax=Streptomyces sp. SID12501 TaxID=2706042 RepID=A0A6B3BTN1_9ACTN|nr:hypothetical protein [Streptomyces sp. SID12501]NEC87721.1 hypothetical protein [Streptomyces sp. SID12501]